MLRIAPLLMLLLLLTTCPGQVRAEAKLVIAEKSSFTLPGSSLPGIAAAVAQGAELIRLNTLMTSDRKVIILNGATLGTLTDVDEHFPERARTDGLFYPVDFSYEEIQQLSLRHQPPTGPNDNSPIHPSSFLKVPLLSDALALIALMSETIDTHPGIVLEIKQSWRYLHEGLDISLEALSLMAQNGFLESEDGFVACYDPEELKRIHDKIMPSLNMSLKTLLLVDITGGETMRFDRGKWQPYNYDWIFTKFGLKSLSTFADAVGFSPKIAINSDGELLISEYFEDAHLLGLKLLAYPFDEFAATLPVYAETLPELADFCLFEAGFDGLVTGRDRILREHLALRQAQLEQERKNPKSPIEVLLENARKESRSR